MVFSKATLIAELIEHLSMNRSFVYVVVCLSGCGKTGPCLRLDPRAKTLCKVYGLGCQANAWLPSAVQKCQA